MKRSLPVMLEAHGLALIGCRRCGHGDDVRPIVSYAILSLILIWRPSGILGR